VRRGFGSFNQRSLELSRLSVGATRSAEFASRICEARLDWNKQNLLVEPEKSPGQEAAKNSPTALGLCALNQVTLR
jgi:hypothetical protein